MRRAQYAACHSAFPPRSSAPHIYNPPPTERDPPPDPSHNAASNSPRDARVDPPNVKGTFIKFAEGEGVKGTEESEEGARTGWRGDGEDVGVKNRAEKGVGVKKYEEVKKYCRMHRPSEYLSIFHKACAYVEGCPIIASFGSKEHGVAKFCARHKETTHVLMYRTRCRVGGCRFRAIYNDKGSRVRTHCNIHRLAHQVTTVERICEHKGCTVTPIFGDVKEGRPVACRLHSLPEYIDVVNKRCRHTGCLRRPSFGVRPAGGGGVGGGGHAVGVVQWCAKHANRSLHVDLR